MARENYDFCIKEVLKSEGGYSDDPHDPGGPTNYGITIHDYRAYINASGTAEDVRHMTVDQAVAIYKAKYWDAVDGDHLVSGIDYCVFDYGVNSGISRANRIYSSLCTRKHPSDQTAVWFIDKICNERMAYLQRLRTWPYYSKGWTSRVINVRTKSKWLTSQTQSSPPPPTPSSTTCSPPSPSKASPTSWLKTFFTGLFKGNAQTP